MAKQVNCSPLAMDDLEGIPQYYKKNGIKKLQVILLVKLVK